MVTNLLNDIKRVAVCMSVAAVTAFGAQAAETVDLGELANGIPAEYPGGNSSVKAQFTVPEDGPVRVTCTGTTLYGYDSPEYGADHELQYEHSYVNGKPMRTYDCKAGDVIYFYNSFVMDAGTITVQSGEVKLELLSTSPSADPDASDYYGGHYSISKDYRVQFSFNLPIAVDEAKMTVNGHTQALSLDMSPTTVDVTVSPGLMAWYKSGLLKKGDVLTLQLLGVHEKGNADNKVNGDGVATVEFVMDGEPIELVSTKNTPLSGVDNLLSYYVPGNPASLVQLTFSGDLEPEKKPQARFIYGDMDNIDAGMYYEDIEGTVDGRTATFDLAGKLRRPQDMLPLLTDPLDYITLKCHGIYGTDGQWAYTGQLANPNNYMFNYKLQILQYNVVADFTPSASKGIAEGDELEIFVMEGDKIEYSGVNFAYTASGKDEVVTLPKDKLETSMENATDLVIVCAVPALPGIDADSAVTVSLADMTCADGLDHSEAVTAVYKDYTSGLEGVSAEGMAADVYNAQGVLVLKAASRADMRALPAGLYIAAGRKFIVK